MRRAWLTALFLSSLPSSAHAHGGGLDAYGCHTNHKTGDYHCHGQKSPTLRYYLPMQSTRPTEQPQPPKDIEIYCSGTRFPDSSDSTYAYCETDSGFGVYRNGVPTGIAKAGSVAYQAILAQRTEPQPARTPELIDLQVFMRQVSEFKRLPRDAKSSSRKYTDAILKKLDEIKALDAQMGQIIRERPDFSSTSAFLYLMGYAYAFLSKIIYEAPLPEGIDSETAMIIRDELDKVRQPIEDSARSRLTRALELAKTQRLWSIWQTEALRTLAEVSPYESAPEGYKAIVTP